MYTDYVIIKLERKNKRALISCFARLKANLCKKKNQDFLKILPVECICILSFVPQVQKVIFSQVCVAGVAFIRKEKVINSLPRFKSCGLKSILRKSSVVLPGDLCLQKR